MTSIKPTRRVFLIGNARKPSVPAAFERLRNWLDERGVLVGSDLSGHPELINDSHADLVIALGGDGTILSAAQAMTYQQRPIVGVNLGKLGYLADFSMDELERHFDAILNDAGLISERMMLAIVIAEPSGATWRGIAVNDCVIHAGTPFRTVNLRVSVDEYPLTTITSDGLIVATPTGSTAHNMACGGPILEPEIEAIILTPMAPHSLSHRPIVLRSDAQLDVIAVTTNEGTTVVFDGQVIRRIPTGTRLTIHRAREVFHQVRNPDRNGWDTLVNKLKWGQSLGR